MHETQQTYQEWTEQRCRDNPCDICRGEACETHHIARGQNRSQALKAAFATLITCWACHRGPEGIHAKAMPVAQQLAYVHERRFAEFDIEAFYKLTDRRWPDFNDIWRHVLKLRAAADGLRK